MRRTNAELCRDASCSVRDEIGRHLGRQVSKITTIRNGIVSNLFVRKFLTAVMILISYMYFGVIRTHIISSVPAPCLVQDVDELVSPHVAALYSLSGCG